MYTRVRMYVKTNIPRATARHVSRINGGLSTRFGMKLRRKIAELRPNSREHNFCIVCGRGEGGGSWPLWIPQEARDTGVCAEV